MSRIIWTNRFDLKNSDWCSLTSHFQIWISTLRWSWGSWILSIILVLLLLARHAFVGLFWKFHGDWVWTCKLTFVGFLTQFKDECCLFVSNSRWLTFRDYCDGQNDGHNYKCNSLLEHATKNYTNFNNNSWWSLSEELLPAKTTQMIDNRNDNKIDKIKRYVMTRSDCFSFFFNNISEWVESNLLGKIVKNDWTWTTKGRRGE